MAEAIEAIEARPARASRDWGFWLLYYLPWLSVVLRFWVSTVPEFGFQPVPLALMAGFLVLSLSVAPIAARFPALIQPWLVLQTALVAVLVVTPPLQDFYAALILSLGMVSSKYLRPGLDLVWLGVYCAVVTAVLVLAFGVAEGIAYLPSYLMGILFLGLYGRARRRAEDAREKSEELLGQLREANGQLRSYAAQAEEMAAAQERSRLARELHDAATQTVFSITLTAQAARMACDSDPGRLPELLERIQESSSDALAEMRVLVSELRQRRVAEDGLVPTLRQHFAVRERREGLRTIFSIEGEERGSVALRETLLRAVQESLNNVVKHAGVTEAEVSLCFGGSEATLVVRDAGRGFAAERRAGGSGFGLAAMRERVEAAGGALAVVSGTGEGTRITVRMPLPVERESDGEEPAHQGPGR
jgi:signal transduction histidine kinase